MDLPLSESSFTYVYFVVVVVTADEVKLTKANLWDIMSCSKFFFLEFHN